MLASMYYFEIASTRSSDDDQYFIVLVGFRHLHSLKDLRCVQCAVLLLVGCGSLITAEN